MNERALTGRTVCIHGQRLHQLVMRFATAEDDQKAADILAKKTNAIGKVQAALWLRSTAETPVCAYRTRFEQVMQALGVAKHEWQQYLVPPKKSMSAADGGEVLGVTAAGAMNTTASVLSSQGELYKRIGEVLKRVRTQARGSKILYLAALHGIGEVGRQHKARTTAREIFAPAENEFRKWIRSSKCEMRLLTNVTAMWRFKEIMQYCASTPRSSRFQLRAFSFHGPAIPLLCPLIVGDTDAFIARDDPLYARAFAGVHLQGSEVVPLLQPYFDRLWNWQSLGDSAHPLFILREPAGIIPNQIAALRALLKKSDPKKLAG
jgi:hypothetical protein